MLVALDLGWRLCFFGSGVGGAWAERARRVSVCVVLFVRLLLLLLLLALIMPRVVFACGSCVLLLFAAPPLCWLIVWKLFITLLFSVRHHHRDAV